jgi:Protein of unknown function (DUF4238)
VAAVARENGARENQHYVPKFLLRNFAELDKNRSEKVWAFDKSNSSIFCTNLRNIAAECGFYDIDGGDEPIPTESLLSELEGHAAQALRKIVEERSLGSLSSADRDWLANFCAVQFVRVPNLREKQSALDDCLKRKIVESGGDANGVVGFKPMTTKDVKEFAVTMILRAAKEFAPYFANKVCLLLETNVGDPFFVSDNPIALHNENDFRPYGNLGLAVAGIEIYLPITPTLTLTFWDRSVPERLLALVAAFKARVNGTNLETSLRTRRPEELIGAAQTGGRAHCASEVVMFLNSLQVINASRFVISATKGFALATRMLQEKPHLRLPPLFEMS